MRLHLLLPKVDPKAIPVPSKCGYADCTSKQVRMHQKVAQSAPRHGAKASWRSIAIAASNVDAPFASILQGSRMPRVRCGSRGWP